MYAFEEEQHAILLLSFLLSIRLSWDFLLICGLMSVLYSRFSLSTCVPQDPEAAIRCGSWVVADSPASDEAAFFVESDAWDPTSIDPSAKWLSWNSTDWVAPEVCRSLLFLHISCDFLADAYSPVCVGRRTCGKSQYKPCSCKKTVLWCNRLLSKTTCRRWD